MTQFLSNLRAPLSFLNKNILKNKKDNNHNYFITDARNTRNYCLNLSTKILITEKAKTANDNH